MIAVVNGIDVDVLKSVLSEAMIKYAKSEFDRTKGT